MNTLSISLKLFRPLLVVFVFFSGHALFAQAKYAGTYFGTISTRVTVAGNTIENTLGAYSAVVTADGKISLTGTSITGTVNSSGIVTFKAESSPVLGLTKGKIVDKKLSTEFADGKLLGAGTSRYRLNPSTSFLPPAKPTISIPPASATVKLGAPVKLTVTATGTGLKYQWQKNGVNISGATSATYRIAEAVPGTAGKYRVIVKNATGSVTSPAAVITVNLAPANLTPASGSAILATFTGTVQDSLEGSSSIVETLRITSSTTMKGPGYTGTYSYTRLTATTARVTYSIVTTDTEEGYVEEEAGTITLTFTSGTAGSYTSSGSYSGTDTGDSSTYSGTFTGKGKFKITK